MKEEEKDREQLERNIEKLLSHVHPEVAMPEETKAKVLSALLEGRVGASSKLRLGIERRLKMLSGKRMVYGLAAAIAVTLLLFFLWPGVSTSGIAWADVIEKIENVRTMTGIFTVEERGPSGEEKVTRSKIYYKDPSKARFETYYPGTERIQAIRITDREPDRAVMTNIYPDRKEGERTSLIFKGTILDERKDDPLDMAGLSWLKLKNIASERMNEVGVRDVDGIPAAGFEASMREVFSGSKLPTPDGVIRVWVNRETVVPVAVDAEFEGRAGFQVKSSLTEIEWNVALVDELFSDTAFDDYEIGDTTVTQIGFRKTHLKSHVTFSIGPRGGEPVVTEADIAEITSGEAVSGEGGPEVNRVRISLTVTEEAGKRVHSYTRRHIGEWMLININGESQASIKIGGVIRRGMQIDITGLRLSLEEFEDKYLTSGD
jgi:outer membrane lipoprotein-sorting protein